MIFKKDESGNVFVLAAMCIPILIGFAGMALDVGMLYRVRQNVQIAANAGAVAGALNYIHSASDTSAQSAGAAAATVNGYTSGTNGATVTINAPPTSGPLTSAGYVEAIVTENSPTTFMALFGFGKVNVTARAVAGSPITGDTCMWVNNFTLKGSGSITAPGCGLYVGNTLDINDNGVTLSVAYIDLAGTVTKKEPSPTPIPVTPRTNPFGNLSGPATPSACNITSTLTSVTSANVATVQGSGNQVVCFTNDVTLSSVTLNGGAGGGVVYVFENGLSVSGTVQIGSGSCGATTCTTTAGAVMDIQGGSLSSSNWNLSIFAPTTGTYNGIAILQPSTNTTKLQVQFGSNSTTLDGYIYAPGAEVFLQDEGGSGVIASGIVADSLDVNSQLTLPYDTANAGTTPNRIVTLAE
jgi:Flp pilus assembly protein TadG